jgi:peptidoglycan glycosyltransferase
MNKPLRRIGMAMMVMIVLLLANDMYVQVIHGDEYRQNPRNQRTLLNQYSRDRGLIVDAAGNTIAGAKATNDRLKYQRTYANGPLYAPVTGYFSVRYAQSGIEQAENSILNGSDDRLFVRQLSNLITGRDPSGGSVQVTIDPRVQKALYHAMSSRGFTGGAVATDPKTGAILGMVSTPSYDPSPLASHDGGVQTKAWKKYTSAPHNPLVNKAIDDPRPPGSTFKLIDSAAALSSGKYTPDSKFPAAGRITIPGTNTTFDNYDREHCGPPGTDQVTMTTALAYSCNTAFGTLAAQLGEQSIRDEAHNFGVGHQQKVPMKVSKSSIGEIPSKAALYSVGIGQQNVRFTPMQSAVITSTIANDGVRMKPQMVKAILAPDLSTISKMDPQQVNQPISADVANQITAMMKQSEKHTTDWQQYKQYDIASKTGTAEHGPPNQHLIPYGWYTAFAPANDPKIAVSVMITHGSPYGQNTVGANVAGPVGHAAIQAYLGGG